MYTLFALAVAWALCKKADRTLLKGQPEAYAYALCLLGALGIVLAWSVDSEFVRMHMTPRGPYR